MAKYYFISCKAVGVLDCDFSTSGETIEKVVEQCADHARQYHELKGFGPEIYAKMRPHIREVDEAAPAT
jgi:predicted small metal-binding protein